MSRPHRRAITVRVIFEDACDGIVRLMNDAQRFGLTVCALTVHIQANETFAALKLLVPDTTDLDSLASRLGRHPTFRGGARIQPYPHGARPSGVASECGL